MAQAIHNPIRRPSMCEPPIVQIATSIGDLQDDFRWIQGLTDFLQEELTHVDPAPRQSAPRRKAGRVCPAELF